jgi:hypothetical protein
MLNTQEFSVNSGRNDLLNDEENEDDEMFDADEFFDSKIKTILNNCFARIFDDCKFEENTAEMTKQLSALIRVCLKTEVPKFTTTNYKHIIQVLIAKKDSAGPLDAFKIATQGIIDQSEDKHVFHTYCDRNIYCLVQVFCLNY